MCGTSCGRWARRQPAPASRALLTFNLGVEAGQLLTVAAVWVLRRAVRQMKLTARLKTPALYTIASLAAYWSWLRIASVVA